MTVYFPFGLGAAYIALYIFYTTDKKRRKNVRERQLKLAAKQEEIIRLLRSMDQHYEGNEH